MKISRETLARLEKLAGPTGCRTARAAPCPRSSRSRPSIRRRRPRCVPPPRPSTGTSPIRCPSWSWTRPGRRGASPTSAPGAGWPGLALAAALPGAHVSLVESAVRHCRYLERALEEAGLDERRRRQRARRGMGRRASGRRISSPPGPWRALPVLCEYAAPLLAEGGSLVAWKAAVDARGAGRRPRCGADPRPRAGGAACGCARTRARVSTRSTPSARSRPRRSGSHAGPEWRRSGPSL